MSEQARPPHRRIGPFLYAPKPGKRGEWDLEFGALLFIPLLLVLFGHETAYRLLPVEEREYPFLGLISHFGFDMLIVGGAVTVTAVVLLHWREK